MLEAGVVLLIIALLGLLASFILLIVSISQKELRKTALQVLAISALSLIVSTVLCSNAL